MEAIRTVDCVDVAFEMAKLASFARRTPPSSPSWPLALPRADPAATARRPKGQRFVRNVLLFVRLQFLVVAHLGRHRGRRYSRQQAGKACERGFQLSDKRLVFGIPRKGLERCTHVALLMCDRIRGLDMASQLLIVPFPFFQSQKQRTERHGDEGPRHGAASRKVSSESADQVEVNYRTGASPATTP